MSVPLPRKPATELSTSSAGPGYTDALYYADGTYAYTLNYPGPPHNTLARRSYGTGYPSIQLSPTLFFKKPSAYSVLTVETYKKLGTVIFVGYANGKVSEVITGSGNRQNPDGSQENPYFTGYSLNPIPLNMYNRLSTEVMNKVGSKKASTGQALAESKESIHMIIGSARQLFTALRLARKGNFGGAAIALGLSKRRLTSKNFAGKWLELQFGWLPLMSDIYDHMELVKKGFREKSMLASSERHIKDSSHYHNDYGSSEIDMEGHAVYSMKVFYSIDQSTLRQLSETGLLNPLEIAWELVPWSFAIDWFLPVGNFLNALTAPIGTNFVGGYYSVKADVHFEQRVDEYTGSWQYPVSNTIRGCADLSGYSRYPLTGFPRPALYFKDPFSIGHLLNAFALIRQLAK